MTNGYGYEKSETGRYELTRDGVTVLAGSEHDCWVYLHQTHSYSVEHALRFEGYAIAPLLDTRPVYEVSPALRYGLI